MVTVNLIPEGVQLAQTRRRHVARWLAAGIVSLSLVGLAFAMEWLNRAEARDLRAQHTQLQVEAKQADAKLQTLSTQVNDVQLRVERARALRGKRAWSGVVALIAQALPESCWLTSVATNPVQPRGAQSPGSSGKRKLAKSEGQAVAMDVPRKLEIVGYAPEASLPYEFVSALKSAEAFSRVTLVRSQVEAVLDGFHYRFELVCEW